MSDYDRCFYDESYQGNQSDLFGSTGPCSRWRKAHPRAHPFTGPPASDAGLLALETLPDSWSVMVWGDKYEVHYSHNGSDFYATRNGERWKELSGDTITYYLAAELAMYKRIDEAVLNAPAVAVCDVVGEECENDGEGYCLIHHKQTQYAAPACAKSKFTQQEATE